MLFVNNSDTRGRWGRGGRGLLKKAWRKLYNRESFTGTLTKVVTIKSFARLFNGRRIKAEPLCMSLELTLQTSRGRGNAPKIGVSFC